MITDIQINRPSQVITVLSHIFKYKEPALIYNT